MVKGGLMQNNNYTYSPNCRVIRKSYGDIHLTITVEIPETIKNRDGRDIIIQMLADVSDDIINDFNRTRTQLHK